MALTASIDGEIMGMKEAWREQGYSESEIDSLVKEAYETSKAQAEPPDLERVKEELTAERESPAELEEPRKPKTPHNAYSENPGSKNVNVLCLDKLIRFANKRKTWNGMTRQLKVSEV